jgi:aspartyl protease family protein
LNLLASEQPSVRVQVNAILNNAVVLTINGNQQMIRKNAKSSEGYQLIKITSNSATLLIDDEQQVFKLGAAITSSKAGRSGKQSVSINRDRQGMYFTTGTINNTTVKFLVDTGATSIAINSVLANRLGIDYLIKGNISQAQTASGIVTTWQLKLDKVSLGDVELLYVEAVVIEGNFPTQPLLGMSFLNRVKMQDDGLMLTIEEKR